MRVLLIDNYDSFVYNLYHLIMSVKSVSSVDIFYCDEITIEKASFYDRIVISPGPGVPSPEGTIPEIIRNLSPKIPMLGVCLGHQAIAQAFGAELYCVEKPYHGIKDTIQITNHSGIFRGMPDVISAGRYHSWLVSEENLPASLKITAVNSLGNIMAISHTEYNVHGVQFHPESVMTPTGKTILENFLSK